MKKLKHKRIIKVSILSALLLSLFSMANAQSFTFSRITSDCSGVSDMTTTLTITEIKVTGVHSYNDGFDYTIIFSNKNEFTGTGLGNFYTYEVAFQSDNLDVTSQGSASFNADIIPMSSTTTNNLEVTYNTYDGSTLPSMVSGVTYSDPAIIRTLDYATATLKVGSQCFTAGPLTSTGITLPVKLVRFNATKVNQNVLLTWTTLSEQNNKGYEIQRSADVKNWSMIGFVPSKTETGNSAESTDYTFTDMAPLNGVHFYRLKQIDLDQRFEYSEIRKISFARTSSISIYPNPVQSVVNISGLELNDVIRLSNLSGKVLQTIEANNKTIAIEMNSLPNGIYHISIRKADGTLESFRFVKGN